MTLRERLDQVLAELPEHRLCEVLDFAGYLRWLEHRNQEERRDWQQFGLSQFARAYGPEEPEYTAADLKPEHQP
jgi:hypothetical protein